MNAQVHTLPTSPYNFNLDGAGICFPVTERPLEALGSKGGHLPVPNSKAIVRANNDGSQPRVVGVVGSDYKLVKYRDHFTAVEDALRQSVPADLMRGAFARTRIAGDGGWVRREYVLPAYSAELETSAKFQTSVGFRAISWASIDGSSSNGLICGLIDFFCENGMVIGAMTDIGKRRHTKNLTADYFTPMLQSGLETVGDEVTKLRKMAQAPLDMDAAVSLIHEEFSETRAKKLVEQMEEEIATRGSNVFALHSALTFYASHDSDRFKLRSTGREAANLNKREEEVSRIMPKVFALAA